jgi:hypothetical protein
MMRVEVVAGEETLMEGVVPERTRFDWKVVAPFEGRRICPEPTVTVPGPL